MRLSFTECICLCLYIFCVMYFLVNWWFVFVFFVACQTQMVSVCDGMEIFDTFCCIFYLSLRPSTGINGYGMQRVAFSKNISDATLKRDGKELPVRERPPKKKKAKKRVCVEESPKKKKKRKKMKEKFSKMNGDDVQMKNKENDHHNHSSDKSMHASSKKKRKSQKSMAPPNKMLFLQNLPKDASMEEMQRLFFGFQGFLGVNLIENKPGIGFAEFDDTYNSSTAQRSLNGLNVRGKDIIVEFAQ